MITSITIYSKSIGILLRNITIDDSQIQQQLQNDENYIEGLHETDKYYIDTTQKTLVTIPDQPGRYYVFDFINKDWVFDINLAKQDVLYRRQIELASSDWTDTVSAQTRLTNWQQWQDYRQALRDIPLQSGYPLDVVWPTPPS